MTREQLAKFIKQKRKKNNIPLQDMAQRIGVKPEALCRMESGKYWLNCKNLFAILDVLEIKILE
jgi:transcriptional regulator with XRE-family HTH domain